MADGICSIDGCEMPAQHRGWCGTHYSRWWTKGDPLAPVRHRSPKRPEGCSVPGCDAPGFRREWCVMHYTRWQRNGDAGKARTRRLAIDTFNELVQIETDACVLWPHGTDASGYGRVSVNGATRKVHQWALELRIPRPPGLLACHRPGIGCARNCMNYRHLYWGTHADNMRDKIIDGTSRWKHNRMLAAGLLDADA